MHTFFLLLWGTYTLASIVGAITIVVLHGRRLRQDMKLRDEGIYITRVPRREALISLLTPVLPAGFFAFYLYTQVELGILFNLLAFILLPTTFCTFTWCTRKSRQTMWSRSSRRSPP